MYTVKQARVLRGFTQSKIAEKMGINIDTYRRIERNPEKITIEKAKQFCEIVGMSVDNIFFDTNSTLSREPGENKSA